MKGLVQKLGMATAVFAMTSAPIAYADDANTNRATATSYKPANDFKATQITEKALPSVDEQIKLLEAQAREDAKKGIPTVLYNPNVIDEFDYKTLQGFLEDNDFLGLQLKDTKGDSKLFVPFSNPPVFEKTINNSSSFSNGKLLIFIRDVYEAGKRPVVVASID